MGQGIDRGPMHGTWTVLRDVDFALAEAAWSLIPGGGGQSAALLDAQVLIADVESLPARIMPDPEWAIRLLAGSTESAVRFDALPLEATAVGLMDPSGVPFIHYAMEASGELLGMIPVDDANH